LNSKDIQVNKKIFVGMGGVPNKADERLQRVTFPGVVVILNPGSPSPPPTGRSVGTVGNHVGFTVQHLKKYVATCTAAGEAGLPGTELRFAKDEKAQITTKGRALDHIGFDVLDLQGFIKKLEANGIKLDRPYTKNQETGAALAFITDPWGTYIELNERPGAV